MSQFPPPIPPSSSPLPPTQGSFQPLPPTVPGLLQAGMVPHRGGLVLGLGIASLGVWFLSAVGAAVIPCCGGSFLVSLGLAIPAWVMGSADLTAMNTGRMDPSGRSTTQGGRICAIISVVIHVLTILAILVLLIVGIAFAGFAASRNP